jgi:hypothetical protein
MKIISRNFKNIGSSQKMRHVIWLAYVLEKRYNKIHNIFGEVFRSAMGNAIRSMHFIRKADLRRVKDAVTKTAGARKRPPKEQIYNR